MINFEQTPQWNKDTKFEITGEQFDKLSEIYGNLHLIMNDIFETNLNLGNITIKYITEEGKEISKQDVEKMMDEVEKSTIK